MESVTEKFQALRTGEKIILIAGAVLFVAGFLPWYSLSVEGLGTFSRSGWQSPGALWSMIPVLIGLAMSGTVAAKAFTQLEVPDGIAGQSWATVYLAGGAIALVSVGIKYLGESSFLGYGFYIGFLAAAGLAGAGLLLFKEERALPANVSRFNRPEQGKPRG